MSLSKAKIRIALSRMPALHHSSPDPEAPFDIMKSAALDWALQQPDVRQFCWEQIRSLGFLVYDPESRTWAGEEIRPRPEGEKSKMGSGITSPMTAEQFVQAVRGMPGILGDTAEGVRVGAMHSYLTGNGHKIAYHTVTHLVSLVPKSLGAMDWKTRLFKLNFDAVTKWDGQDLEEIK